MKEHIKEKEGSMTIEACLCLTLFMFFILFLYSFFSVFEAQMKIHHTLLQTAQSLSLDAVATDGLTGNILEGEVSTLYQVATTIGFNAANKNPEFVSPEKWYKDENDIPNVVKERFVAYLTGGDSGTADELLKSYRIEKGLSGLDFSASKIDSDGNIVLKVKYSVQFMFDYKAFGMEPIEFTNSAVSRKWE